MSDMSEPFFKPWVGETYYTTTPKILVLGESHYGWPDQNHPLFTQGVIKDWALGERGSRKFFTVIAKILFNKPYEWISREEKQTFWGKIIFYNYVQSFVGEKARIRPTPEMWASAVAPFKNVLEEYFPDIVVVLGVELGRHVQPLEKEFSQSISFCYWTHPSAPSFKKQEALDCFEATKSKYGA